MSKTNKALLLEILQDIKEFKSETNAKFESIDRRFEEMDKRFEKVDKRFKTINENLININNHIQRDADISELEVNQSVRNHLEKIFEGYDIIQYDKKFKSIRDPYDQSVILTDFDGLLLLQSKNEQQFPNAKRIFVIVEAKNHMTLEKVQLKIEQKNKLYDFIQISKNPELLAKTTNKFQQTALGNKLKKISDVFLYLGGPVWEPDAKRFAENEYKKELENGEPTIGIVSITGERYNIKDFASLAKGGRKK